MGVWLNGTKSKRVLAYLKIHNIWQLIRLKVKSQNLDLSHHKIRVVITAIITWATPYIEDTRGGATQIREKTIDIYIYKHIK